MKAISLLGVAALFAASAAEAQQQRFAIGGYSPPGRPGGGFHGHHRGFAVPWIVDDRVVVVEREIVREVPAAPPQPLEPPSPPRKPYVIGASYASLPGGCMKQVEAGGSYFYCSGDWYRQVGKGQYKAVREP